MVNMNTSRFSAAARLDRLPILKFHRKLFGLVAGGMFLDNFDIYVAGAIMAVLLNQSWSTLDLNAAFVSATFAGMLIGTIGTGLIADKFGRRLTFQFNLAIFGIASILCAIAPDMHYLIFFRFLCGIGLGAELVVGYSTLAEFTPPARRGRWQALMSMISSFGLLASTLLSFLLIPYFGWRIMLLLPGIAAIILLLMRKAIPESPRWLELQGRHGEADKIVSNIEQEANSGGISLTKPHSMDVRAPERIFQRKFIRPLLLGTILQVVMFAAVYGLVSWVPTFLTNQGMSLNQSLAHTVLMACGGPVGAFFAQLLADRLGRRKAIIFGSLIAALMALLFGYASTQLMVTIIGFATFVAVFFLLATVQAVYLPELFPTEVRMRCNSFCIGIARISSIVTPFIIVSLFEQGGLLLVLGVIAALFLIQAIAMLFLGVETSRRSIDDVLEDLVATQKMATAEDCK
ncbi:MFS transporter [Klebsiella sp. 2680]|uniref:MFS transporter n=1 Tax=Klebsiella sp. 2680 TaxID=2018037 RepID=UPI001C8CFBB3|nr:MFS transporter [Klebsiella sp. 2680]